MLGVPLFGTSSVLVRPYDSTVDEMDFPLNIAFLVRLFLHALEEFLPQSFFAPFVEAAEDRLPRTVPLRQVSPGSAGPQDPQDTVDDLAMILARPSCFRFLRWQERLELFPLLVRQFVPSSHMSIVTDETQFSNAP